MLTAVEAHLRNPGLPVEADLAARTAEFHRLRGREPVSIIPLSASSWSAGVLHAAVATVDGRIAIEAEVRPGGEIQLHRHG